MIQLLAKVRAWMKIGGFSLEVPPPAHTVIWTCFNIDVATVSSNGQVYTHHAGVSLIMRDDPNKPLLFEKAIKFPDRDEGKP